MILFKNTRLKIFAPVLISSFALAALAGLGVVKAGIKAGISLSGVPFVFTADRIEGVDFGVFGRGSDLQSGKQSVVSVNFSNATMSNICLSSVFDIPILGKYTFLIRVKEEDKVNGTTIVMLAKKARANIILRDFVGGADQGNLKHGQSGLFSIQASKATITNVRIDAVGLNTDELKLQDLAITTVKGDHGC